MEGPSGTRTMTVFGPNRAAQSLYEDLGIEVTVLQIRKHVIDGPDSARSG
jgi:hypothetical protein